MLCFADLREIKVFLGKRHNLLHKLGFINELDIKEVQLGTF